MVMSELTIGPDDFDEVPGNMMTARRQWIDPLHPKATDINLGDISEALANTCRYGGQLNNYYSVAEHCIYVAHQLYRTTGDKALALSGLLHDAHEAYTGDFIRPIKRHLADLKHIEAGFDYAITEAFGLTVPLTDPRIKQVDTAILPWEMAMFRMSKARPAAQPASVAFYYRDTFWDYNQ